MKPREKLVENIVDLVHARRGDENYDNLVKLLEATLKTHYAIGKWVPVSERLPDVSQYYYVQINGEPEGGCCFDNSINMFDQRNPPISHWLELELPEVSQ